MIDMRRCCAARRFVWYARVVCALSMSLCASFGAGAQDPLPGGPPAPRVHTTVQSPPQLHLEPASQLPSVADSVTIGIEGRDRVIRANGIPTHLTGRFPNRGNPHRIIPQSYVYRVPASPRLTGRVTPLHLMRFGIATNGVVFDPGAAEWFEGRRHEQWRYEALSGAVPLGLDKHFAHVQPNGAYHYHALPLGWLRQLDWREDQHSPIVGWAADGFPIYAITGYADARDASASVKA